MFFAALVLVLTMNGVSGAFDSDLGGGPDEAAHAVTSLMLRDYLAGHAGENPIRFAEAYYERFPKIALGHYPPLFYAVAGVWLIPFVSADSLLVLEAICAALFATMTFVVLRARFGPLTAAVGGIAIVLFPTVQKLSQHVMSDILLGLLCLVATWIWSHYLEKPTWSRALAFGVVAAAAILTKGSGMLLGLVPATAAILSGRWRLFLTPSFWASAAPVVLAAGPWMIYSTKISKEGMTKLSPLEYFSDAMPYYLASLPHVFSWPLLMLVCVGFGGVIFQSVQKKKLDSLEASLCALLIGSLAVLLLIPVGLTTRYLLPLIPVVMFLAARGAWAIQGMGKGQAWVASALLAAAVAPAVTFPKKQVTGFCAAVDWVRNHHLGGSWIVSSDPRGEGAIVAAGAFGVPDRVETDLTVYRAGKELAASDWMGRDYVTKFDSTSLLLSHLDKNNVRVAFVDISAGEDARLPHEHLLEKALKQTDSGWELALKQPISRTPWKKGELLVFVR